MTEPDTPGLGPDPAAHAAPCATATDWVIDGHKWFSSNGSIADFLIVMAVTNPDARPSQRASMFIVPVDTPGVEIVRDVPTMEHPWEQFGSYGGHAEILYERRARARRGPARRARARASSSPSSGSARGASTTACAGSGSHAARST